LQRRLRQYSPKLALVFFVTIAALVAQQDVTNYLTPEVAHVGNRLACRCGGCKETIGTCPMLRCDSADPKRRRIFEMKSRGISDDAIVNTFFHEEGAAALSSPLPLHLITWLATPIALLFGFWVYTSFIRKNRKPVAQLTADDRAMMDRFRSQIDPDFDEPTKGGKAGADLRK
jgi:hypothetical protein